jgi:hypothetical protein
MNRIHAYLFVLGVAIACADGPTAVRASKVAFTKAPVTAQEKSADLIARAFSSAMRDATIRATVRDAMRSSLITEHKLLLQDFVHTPSGRALLDAGARRLGVTTESLQELVAQLPALDFYVPSRIHRLSWHAEPTVRVGYFLSHDVTNARAYDTNGDASPLVENLNLAGNATFVLQPAERTSRRIHPQKTTLGSVIEDVDDGTLSGSVVDYLPDGTTRVTELADLYLESPTSIEASLTMSSSAGLATILTPAPMMAPKYIIQCDEPGGEPCQTEPYYPSDTTFLEDVVILGVVDNYSATESNEFEWHTYFSTDNGSTWTDRHDFRLEGVRSYSNYHLHLPVLFRKLRSSNERIKSDVVETDIWADDHFGSPQWNTLENNVMMFEGEGLCGQTIYYQKSWGGTPPPYVIECGYQSITGRPPQYYDWKSVNQSFAWNP